MFKGNMAAQFNNSEIEVNPTIKINPDLMFSYSSSWIQGLFNGHNPVSNIVQLSEDSIYANETGSGLNKAAEAALSVGKMFEDGRFYAKGGITTQPHIGMVGEAGPEAVIPLTGANKKYGVELWKQAGELLGMIPRHAKGGIFGNGTVINSDLFKKDSQKDESAPVSVSVNLGGVNITIHASDIGDGKSVIDVIRENMPEISNEVAQAIAEKLPKIFANMKAGTN